MPWTFDGDLPRCALFRQWLAKCPEGVEHQFSGTPGLEPTGEPGIYRAATVSALLEGTFRVQYMGWPDYEVSGFSQENGHTDLPQCGPSGHSVTTAIGGPALWWCANPKGDKRLEYETVRLADVSNDAGFTAPDQETFIVPLQGSIAIGGQTLERFQIGRRADGGLIQWDTLEPDTIVCFIWERS